MTKKMVKIAGYNVTQLSETDYEIANPQEQLDFYFEVNVELGEVECLVFDSTIPNRSKDYPFLQVYSAKTIEEAVADVIQFKIADIKRIAASE